MEDWRLIRDGASSGAWNMATDEALLESCRVGAGTWGATLRLYGWAPAALSFGRGQPARFDPVFVRREHIRLVRRPTGGLAVLHDDERTYALCAPLRKGSFPGGVLETYRRIAAAVERGLRAMGAEARSVGPLSRTDRASAGGACFADASAHEIAVSGRKLVGSAQLRRGGAFLQHGSIPLTADPARTAAALGTAPGTPRMADLRAVLGHRPDPGDVDAALSAAFAAVFGVRLVPASLTAAEQELATRLYAWKYSSMAWIVDGRAGTRERRWGPPLAIAG